MNIPGSVRHVLLGALLFSGNSSIGGSTEGTAAVYAGAFNDDVPADVGRELSGVEVIEALEMIAGQIRGNLDRIETWSGVWEFADCFRFYATIPSDGSGGSTAGSGDGDLALEFGLEMGPEAGGGYWEITRGTASFSLDMAADRYHVFYEPNTPLTFVDVASGQVQRWKSNGDAIHWVRTPESSLEFDIRGTYGQIRQFPAVGGDSTNSSRVVFRRPSDGLQRFTRYLDARRPFSDSIGGHRHDESLEITVRGLQTRTLHPSADEQGGPRATRQLFVSDADRITYTLIERFPDVLVATAVYDAGAGFNAVSFGTRDESGIILSENVTTFAERDGIFIPERFSEVLHSRDGRMTVRRNWRLQSMVLNTPVRDSEFHVGQFGLKHGERMVDEIENRLLVYDELAGFVEADKFGVTDSPKVLDETRQRSINWTAIVLMNVLLLVVGCVLWFRYKGSAIRNHRSTVP